MRYAGKPALATGLRYFVRVTVDGGSAAQGRPFFLASSDLRRSVEERKQKLKARIAEEVPRQLAIAIYLSSQGLTADALLLLDDLVAKNDSAALRLLRAKSLDEVGANAAKIEALRSALNEAERHNQLESEAEALLELAQAATKSNEAIAFSRRAARILRDLGEHGRAKAVEKEFGK